MDTTLTPGAARPVALPAPHPTDATHASLPAPHPHRIRTALARTAFAVGRYAGAFGDGFVAAGVVAWLVAVALTMAARHFGFGPLDGLLPAAIAATAIGLVAGAVRLVVGALRRGSEAIHRAALRRTEHRLPRALAGAPAAGLRRVNATALGLVCALVVLGQLPGDVPAALVLPAGLLVPAILVASVTVGLLQAARVTARRAGRLPRAVAAVSIAVAVILAGSSAAWAAWPGDATGVGWTAAIDAPGVSIDAPDPAAPGPWPVRTTSYGSGTDRHRPAYGPDVPIRTPTVSAPTSLHPYPGVLDDGYRAFWGFGFDRLPLNALVWYPAGPGPFPLVLVVHGNHEMGEFSEPGYAYLAERLASHGMVVASIDENFLNGGFAGDLEGREMPTRAWLLLVHLDQWRSWNDDPGSPFHGLVDLDRVALVGHSRGGEAASVAAGFSRLEVPPMPGLDPWPTGLRVRAVVSIAPSDGQYGNGTIRLEDTDFLTITGGNDADAWAWSGIRQYARTSPAENGFKAAVWAYRANHGQFNTVWGASDHGPFAMWLVNREALMPAADQERIARVYIGGFLAASLQEKEAYRALFRSPAAGRDWLPEQVVLVRSSDGGFEPLLDASRPRERLLEGVQERTVELRRINVDLPLRGLQDTQQNRVDLLRWQAGPGRAEFTLDLKPAISAGLTGEDALRFALADGRPAAAAGTLEPLEPLVALTTRDGVRVERPLSDWAPVPPPLPAAMYKTDDLARSLGIGPDLRSPVERVLQTWSLPLADFVAADGRFDPARVAAVSIVFDRATDGTVFLDEVGFARP